MHYRLNTIVFLEFGHCKSSSCQEQKMVGMLGLHEALPKWQFESIIVFFKVACCSKGNVIQLFRERLSEKVHATIPKGIVGGFEFTVFQRNLREWHGRPRTYVCEC